MPSPEEQAYSAVERAYGQGAFPRALELALALQPQLEPGRPDLLDQRLQLLIGHLHLYGLAQPREAEAAYQAVLDTCQEANYCQLAEQSLLLCAQQPDPPKPTPASTPASQQPTSSTPNHGEPSELPATPWLQQLQDPQQALSEIQEAWASVVPLAAAEPAPLPATGEAATPWSPPASSPVEINDASAEPPAITPIETPLISQTEPPAQAPEDPPAHLSAPNEAASPEPERNETMARELERGLLLVKLSGRERLPEAKAPDQFTADSTHHLQQEPPKAGGSWQRFKSRWLQFSRQQPNGGGGSGR